METVITVLIIGEALGGAVTYIVRSKKKGVKCIGCPSCKECARKGGSCH